MENRYVQDEPPMVEAMAFNDRLYKEAIDF